MYEVILLMIIGVILSGISIVLGRVIFERKFSKLSIDKITQTYISLPKIMMVSATSSPITLPDTPIDGTLMVYGTFDNGVPNTELKYVSGDTAGEGTYVVATVDDVTTITLPTDATASVWIKYELLLQTFLNF